MLSPDAPLEVFDVIDSTNLEARRRVDAGQTTPVWLLARTQTAGRGRRGRIWLSAPGNLFATYLGQSGAPTAQIALLGFAAGLAIAEAADVLIGAGKARLKWPNDIMLDGRKAAGILMDSGPADGGGCWFALGFGVNLAGVPSAAGQPAAAMQDHLSAPPPTPEAFLAVVRPRLEDWASRLGRDGFGPLREAWTRRAYGLGATVRAQIGSETLEGIARGLSLSGALELETPAGLRLIAAGDVYFAQTES